ncbi:MAG: response regulator transcription factor [Pseudomonadota bacterium]
MKKKRILLVEDHPVFRLGMSEMINQEEDLNICGWAESVAEAWNEVSRLDPDLVIADISLKQSDGLELVRDMKRFKSHIPALVLSMHHETLYAERAIMAGARGYIMKQEAPGSVVIAIRTVLSGRIYLSDDIKEKLLQGFAGTPGIYEHDSPMDRLAPRELEVFRMLGQGLTTREIALRMNLSVKTIGTYRERIKEKLNLRHGNELLKHAVSWNES